MASSAASKARARSGEESACPPSRPCHRRSGANAGVGSQHAAPPPRRASGSGDRRACRRRRPARRRPCRPCPGLPRPDGDGAAARRPSRLRPPTLVARAWPPSSPPEPPALGGGRLPRPPGAPGARAGRGAAARARAPAVTAHGAPVTTGNAMGMSRLMRRWYGAPPPAEGEARCPTRRRAVHRCGARSPHVRQVEVHDVRRRRRRCRAPRCPSRRARGSPEAAERRPARPATCSRGLSRRRRALRGTRTRSAPCFVREHEHAVVVEPETCWSGRLSPCRRSRSTVDLSAVDTGVTVTFTGRGWCRQILMSGGSRGKNTDAASGPAR